MASYFMKKSLFSVLQSITLAMLVVFSTPLHTAPDAIDKQQAVSIAQKVYPGRVLSVKRKDDGYHVKTLSDNGEVRTIIIDADSGKVISEP